MFGRDVNFSITAPAYIMKSCALMGLRWNTPTLFITKLPRRFLRLQQIIVWECESIIICINFNGNPFCIGSAEVCFNPPYRRLWIDRVVVALVFCYFILFFVKKIRPFDERLFLYAICKSFVRRFIICASLLASAEVHILYTTGSKTIGLYLFISLLISFLCISICTPFFQLVSTFLVSTKFAMIWRRGIYVFWIPPPVCYCAQQLYYFSEI